MTNSHERGTRGRNIKVDSRLKLRHLRLIDALCRTGNLWRAAEELNIGQPAASKLLQDAEHIFEAMLFNRSRRSFAPTAVGVHAARYATRCLNETRQVTDDIESLVSGGVGILRIGAIMATMPNLLPFVIQELRRRKPLLIVDLTATTSDRIVDLLEQRGLEVGVCRLAHAGQEALFDFEELFEETYWIFVDKTHRLASREKVEFAELAHEPWAVQPWPSPSRQVLEGAFARAGILMPSSRVETTSRFATLNLVKHAGMIGMLPSTILSEAVGRGELVKLELGPLRPPSKYGLVKRRGENLSDHALDFTSIVREWRERF